jgi:hypothetical protein
MSDYLCIECLFFQQAETVALQRSVSQTSHSLQRAYALIKVNFQRSLKLLEL